MMLSRSFSSSYREGKLESERSDLSLLVLAVRVDLLAPVPCRRVLRRLEAEAAALARSGLYVGRQAQMIAKPR